MYVSSDGHRNKPFFVVQMFSGESQGVLLDGLEDIKLSKSTFFHKFKTLPTVRKFY